MAYLKDLDNSIGINSNDLLHVWNSKDEVDESCSVGDIQGLFGANEEITRAEYENLPLSKKLDGTVRFISDGVNFDIEYSNQLKEMPEASISALGKVYQYIGETNNYIHGYFYECKEENGVYDWYEVSTQRYTVPCFVQPIVYDTSLIGETLEITSNNKVVLTKTLDNTGIYYFVSEKLGLYSFNISKSLAPIQTVGYSEYYIQYSDINFYGRLPLYSFETATDEQIFDILNRYYSDELTEQEINSLKNTYWPVGATRQISLSGMPGLGDEETHVANTYTFAILDHEHDDLTTPINGHTKAFITLGQVEVLTDSSGNAEKGYIMNDDYTGTVGWDNCLRRTWCNDVYFNALPSSIRSLIKSVKKYTSAGNKSSTIVTTNDKVFLVSIYEIFEELVAEDVAYPGEGFLYEYYTIESNIPKYTKDSSIESEVWSRSPRRSTTVAFNTILGDFISAVAWDRLVAIAPSFCL